MDASAEYREHIIYTAIDKYALLLKDNGWVEFPCYNYRNYGRDMSLSVSYCDTYVTFNLYRRSTGILILAHWPIADHIDKLIDPDWTPERFEIFREIERLKQKLDKL